MKQAQLIMGMPVIVEINDKEATPELFTEVFDYFKYVDNKFSTYKETSEISAINRGELTAESWSADMKEIFALADETRKITGGYFDIVKPDGKIDPSGLVKGWAILNAAKILKSHGVKDFYVEAGGDIQVSGHNSGDKPWRIGIENPIADMAGKKEIIKTVQLSDNGIATSGINKRGQHIYNPIEKIIPNDDIISLTVIGPDIYEADRFATAAFAMGRKGIEFIEQIPGLEGYQINKNGIATMTSGFNNYTIESNA